MSLVIRTGASLWPIPESVAIESFNALFAAFSRFAVSACAGLLLAAAVAGAKAT